MVMIKTAKYITTNDVEELTGKRWDEFEFARMAPNDSYSILDCSDEYLDDLYEDYEDTKDELEDFDENDHWARRRSYPNRLRNQIKLIEILRKQYDIKDSILIWISW